MNTPAIHQAIRLSRYPEEMAWLCFPDSEYPEGITDLLRLCTSKKQLAEFADKNGLDSKALHKSLLNFIEKAIVIEENSDEKILGTDKSASKERRKLHYQLLMKIYHPDVNSDPKALHRTTLITKAYQRLKQQHIDDSMQSSINVSEFRAPPKSYYQATQKAEQQISNTRSAIAAVAAVIIFTLVAMMGHFYDPANPELIATKSDNQETNINNDQNQFIMAALTTESIPEITDTKLQYLLRGLESAYEKGNVEIIKPILENAPEIKNQTDQEIREKLTTLFQITSQRKMVLFNFDWINNSGLLQGKGKFLSRYHLAGEEKWLTREGTASIIAQKIGNKLKVTHLELENQSIDQ